MNLIKRLCVGGKPVPLVEDHVVLDLQGPARGTFTVQAAAPLSGIVEFAIGEARQASLTEFFVGYVDASHTVDAKQQKLFCRELSAVLWAILPISIREATLTDILAVYSRKTGLNFAVPDAPYAKTPCPVYQSVGNGIHGLDALGTIFAIPDYIWQQQGNGVVYVGSWQHSRWAKTGMEIPESMFDTIQVSGTKRIPAIPHLRPGVMLNGKRIQSLQLYGYEMEVRCEMP